MAQNTVHVVGESWAETQDQSGAGRECGRDNELVELEREREKHGVRMVHAVGEREGEDLEWKIIKSLLGMSKTNLPSLGGVII